MKKSLTALALLTTATITLAGCGSKGADPAPTSVETTTATASADATESAAASKTLELLNGLTFKGEAMQAKTLNDEEKVALQENSSSQMAADFAESVQPAECAAALKEMLADQLTPEQLSQLDMSNASVATDAFFASASATGNAAGLAGIATDPQLQEKYLQACKEYSFGEGDMAVKISTEAEDVQIPGFDSAKLMKMKSTVGDKESQSFNLEAHKGDVLVSVFAVNLTGTEVSEADVVDTATQIGAKLK